MVKQLFAQIDADHDTKISRAEFTAAIQTPGSGYSGIGLKYQELLFSHLDGQGTADGEITEDELVAGLLPNAETQGDAAFVAEMSGFLLALKRRRPTPGAGVTVRSATGETAPTMLSLESRAEMAAKLEAVEAAKEARAAAEAQRAALKEARAEALAAQVRRRRRRAPRRRRLRRPRRARGLPRRGARRSGRRVDPRAQPREGKKKWRE